MVLDHIADGARLFIVTTTAFNPDIFRHCDLHVIDVAAVPDWLKDTIGQSEDQDILDGLFPQIMVNTINLFLSEYLAHQAVQFASGGEVVPKRFFDNDTRPAFTISIQASRSKILDDVGILAGRRREIEDTIAAGAALLIERIEQCIQFFIARWIMEIRL